MTAAAVLPNGEKPLIALGLCRCVVRACSCHGTAVKGDKHAREGDCSGGDACAGEFMSQEDQFVC